MVLFLFQGRRAGRWYCIQPFRIGELDCVGPFRLFSNKIGVEVQKKCLPSEIIWLIENAKIELLPLRERQIGPIAERDTIAGSCLEPPEEAIEPPVFGDTKGTEVLPGFRTSFSKLQVISKFRLAESRELLGGSTYKRAVLRKFLNKQCRTTGLQGHRNLRGPIPISFYVLQDHFTSRLRHHAVVQRLPGLGLIEIPEP